MTASNTSDTDTNRWDLVHNRNFRLLWASQAVSQIGDGLTKVALLWFVYQLTGSALKMTIIGLLQTIPPLVLSPLLGVYLDRLPKKPVMMALDVIRAILIALVPVLYVIDALTLEVLFVLVFFTAIFSTAFGPALAASLPLLVKPSELMSANSLLQSTTNMGILIGPAICGVLIAWLGTENVLYVDAATFLLSAFCLLPIKNHLLTTAPQITKATSKITQDLLVGMRFVFREKPVLRSLLFTTVFYTLGASAFIYVLPLFVNEHIESDPLWLGWLWSSMGAGMLVTSCGLSCVKKLSRKGRVILMAIVHGCGRKRLAITRSFTLGRRRVYTCDGDRGQYGILYAHCVVNHSRNHPQSPNGAGFHLDEYREHGHGQWRHGGVWRNSGYPRVSGGNYDDWGRVSCDRDSRHFFQSVRQSRKPNSRSGRAPLCQPFWFEKEMAPPQGCLSHFNFREKMEKESRMGPECLPVFVQENSRCHSSSPFSCPALAICHNPLI